MKEDLIPIFKRVDGKSGIKGEIPALRYGSSMEEEAVNSFEEIYKRSHKNVKISECGLYVCQQMPFVCGSPDRNVSCRCCGIFCLEV